MNLVFAMIKFVARMVASFVEWAATFEVPSLFGEQAEIIAERFHNALGFENPGANTLFRLALVIMVLVIFSRFVRGRQSKGIAEAGVSWLILMVYFGWIVASPTGYATEHPIYVGVIKTGHYQCVGGGSIATKPDCRESHHWHWRGADISVVNGSAVSNHNPSAYELVAGMSVLPIGNPIRPAEVGSPWPEFDPLAGFFHDKDHTGHIHLAVCGPRISEGVLVDTCG